MKLKRRQTIKTGTSGTFRLKPVKKGIFCEAETDSMKLLTGTASGRWTVKSVRGTRVMELTPAHFRLRFNDTAAAAVRRALTPADASRRAWNESHK